MDTGFEKKIIWGILPLAFIVIIFIMPNSCHQSDRWYWFTWASKIYNLGFKNAYSIPELNYPPFILYILRVYNFMQGSEEAIVKNINYLKAFILIFDFAGVFLGMYWLKKNGINPLYALFILFNIAYLYNTVIWGQVDSVFTTFQLASFIFVLNKKPALSIMFFVLALNMKIQAIVFLPLLILLLIPLLTNKKNIFLSFSGALVTQLVILIPFILSSQVDKIWNVITNSVGFYPVVSMNAYNMWFLFITDGNLMEISNSINFLGVTYKLWGLLLFMLSSSFILLPIAFEAYLKIIKRNIDTEQIRNKSVFLSTALIILAFFYFNTEMHERYSHPALIFIAIYSILNSDYLLYILFSVGYFLNMEGVLRYLNLNNYGTLIFNPRFISAIFLTCLVIGLYKLYVINKPVTKEIICIIRSKLNFKAENVIQPII